MDIDNSTFDLIKAKRIKTIVIENRMSNKANVSVYVDRTSTFKVVVVPIKKKYIKIIKSKINEVFLWLKRKLI